MRKAEAVRGVCMGDLTGEGVSEESCRFHLPTAAGGYAARKPWQPGELLRNGRSGLVQGPALESETAVIPKAKKNRRGRTPGGIRPRRFTRQRAPRQDRVTLRLVIRLQSDHFSTNLLSHCTTRP